MDRRTGESYHEHRAMAARKLGRGLSPTDVVHHLNEDTTDNHPDNLLVFPSQREHMVWHIIIGEKGVVSPISSLDEILRAHE